MSEITFLASTKPVLLLMKDEEEINTLETPLNSDVIDFWFNEVEMHDWDKRLSKLLTLPYIYEISDASHPIFLSYLESNFEEGDVFELIYFPNQNDLDLNLELINEKPSNILINLKSFIYQNNSGTFKINPKEWQSILKNKNFVTEFGVTTIVKY